MVIQGAVETFKVSEQWLIAKTLIEIGQYQCNNVRFSNKISNLHEALISRDSAIFRNYFSVGYTTNLSKDQ